MPSRCYANEPVICGVTPARPSSYFLSRPFIRSREGRLIRGDIDWTQRPKPVRGGGWDGCRSNDVTKSFFFVTSFVARVYHRVNLFFTTAEIAAGDLHETRDRNSPGYFFIFIFLNEIYLCKVKQSVNTVLQCGPVRRRSYC